jgi:heptosyltransferase-2
LLGDGADTENAREIAAGVSPGRIHDLTGQTTLEQAIAIVAGAKLVVANDSGLMHIGGYLGTPVVGIFGSTSPRWTHPLGKRSGVITAHVPCSPCFEKVCRFGHYNCLKSITPDAVAQCSADVLAL